MTLNNPEGLLKRVNSITLQEKIEIIIRIRVSRKISYNFIGKTVIGMKNVLFIKRETNKNKIDIEI